MDWTSLAGVHSNLYFVLQIPRLFPKIVSTKNVQDAFSCKWEICIWLAWKIFIWPVERFRIGLQADKARQWSCGDSDKLEDSFVKQWIYVTEWLLTIYIFQRFILCFERSKRVHNSLFISWKWKMQKAHEAHVVDFWPCLHFGQFFSDF